MDLVVNMIRDLSLKVDKLSSEQVTRYEFTELLGRIDKFVLHTEFEQYKAFAEQRMSAANLALQSQLDSIVPRSEHERIWSDDEKRFLSIEGKLPTGKIPAWLMTLIFMVLASVCGAVSANYIHPQYAPISQQQSSTTTTASSSTQTTKP